MSRNLSAAAKTALFSQETDKVFLPLLKLYHPSGPTNLRFVRNTKDVVSTVEDGSTNQTFVAFPFNLRLPDENLDGVVKTVQLQIDNVDRSITSLLRNITSAATVTLWIVLASSLNTRELGPLTFTLTDVVYDAQTVTGTLTYEDRLAIRIPALDFNPYDFPGLF